MRRGSSKVSVGFTTMIGGVLVIGSAVYQPKALIGLTFITLSLSLFLYLKWLPLTTLLIGSFFDESYISVGFALLGFGDLGMLIFLPIWILNKFNHRESLRLPHGWAFLISYIALVGVSLLLGERPQVAYGQYVRHCFYVITLFAVVDQLRDLNQISSALWILIGCATFHALAAQIIDNPNARYIGLVGQPNILGFLVGYGLSLLVVAFNDPLLKRWTRLGLGGAMIVTLITLVLTVSRGAYLSFMIALLWFYRKKWRGLILLAFMITSVLILFDWSDPERFEYILRRLQFADKSVSNRQEVMWNAIQLIQERPWFGIGYGQFTLIEEVVSVDAEAGRGSHNHYLGLCASTGLLASFSLFTFIIIQIKGVWRGVSLFSRHSDSRASRDPYTWFVFHALQTACVFQTVSLVFRGSRRVTEWIILALYCVASLYVDKHREES